MVNQWTSYQQNRLEKLAHKCQVDPNVFTLKEEPFFQSNHHTIGFYYQGKLLTKSREKVESILTGMEIMLSNPSKVAKTYSFLYTKLFKVYRNWA